MNAYSGLQPGRKILAVFIVLLLASLACSIPVTGGGTPTSPAGEPTATQPAAPTATQPPVAATTAAPSVSEVTIYLIALEDNGASGPVVGCGDSLVAVRRPVAATDRPIEAALNLLFGIKDEFYGESGLYTALWQSNLSVQSVNITAGAATVALSGQYQLGGTCDTPRFVEQIRHTVLDAPGVDSADILLNGQPIEQALSSQ